MGDNQYYALAASVRLKDITSSAPNRATLHRIKNNDPGLPGLAIAEELDYENGFIPREGDDLGWLGYFIGGNESLTTLSLSYLPGGREQVEKFFIGVQRNRSIKYVKISSGDDILNEGFSGMNLPNVSNIIFHSRQPPGRENAKYFALGLRRCKSLKKYHGRVTSEIVASLSTLPMLEHFGIWTGAWEMTISRDECVALRELLMNATKLKRLDLNNVGLGDDGLELFAEGLACNSSLNDGVLDLSNNNIGDRGVQALASSLASNEILRELILYNNNIGDKGVGALAESLGQNRVLRVLSISGNTSITETGVRAVSRILQSSTSGLENLRINIGAEGGKILADALSINKSLVSLSLSCREADMSICDDGLRALAAGLSRNSTLQELDLSGNTAITAAGLRSLKRYFRSPLCALETLFIQYINFDDECAYALADALGHNKSLQRLSFYSLGERVITSEGWKAFLKLLCDTSSPNSLYLSNHTLIKLDLEGWWHHAGSVRKSIKDWLRVNEVCQTRTLAANFHTGTLAAKFKILHFFPDLDMVPLFQWDLKFLPLAKTWFQTITSANDELAASIRSRELTAIYKFVIEFSLLVVDDFKRFNAAASENPR